MATPQLQGQLRRQQKQQLKKFYPSVPQTPSDTSATLEAADEAAAVTAEAAAAGSNVPINGAGSRSSSGGIAGVTATALLLKEWEDLKTLVLLLLLLPVQEKETGSTDLARLAF